MAANGLRGGGGSHELRRAFTIRLSHGKDGYTTSLPSRRCGGEARPRISRSPTKVPLQITKYQGLLCDGRHRGFLLRRLAAGPSSGEIKDYSAWMVRASGRRCRQGGQCRGIAPSSSTGRGLDIDEPCPHHGVTPRTIIRALARATCTSRHSPPLFIPRNNLGFPALRDRRCLLSPPPRVPIHRPMSQVHSYGTEGKTPFLPRRPRRSRCRNRTAMSVSRDVGQDLLRADDYRIRRYSAPFRNRVHADPDPMALDGYRGATAGCGLVSCPPSRQELVNQCSQWATGSSSSFSSRIPGGLPDHHHPTGGPFSSYPRSCDC